MEVVLTSNKKYIFTTQLPTNSVLLFDGFLFNEENHLDLQPCSEKINFFLIKTNSSNVIARCTFFIEKDHALSPYRAPFGSLEFCESISFDVLDEFWKIIESTLIEKRIKKITIKTYPFCYQTQNSEMLSFLLLSNYFSIQQSDLNYHITVTENSLEKILHENEKKKLKKAEKENYVFSIEKNPDLEKVHSFIKDNRLKKNYPMSIDLNSFKKLFSHFPDQHSVFQLSQENKIAALSVLIQINKKIIYTFYTADDYDFREDSPVVLLHKKMYEYAQEKNIQLIDLGIASENGKPNFSLLKFKEKLGAMPSLKLTFCKNL